MEQGCVARRGFSAGERTGPRRTHGRECYKIVELVGTSPSHGKKAVSQLDVGLEDGRVKSYRVKVKLFQVRESQLEGSCSQ
jgi:flavin-binding protein dodecin